MSITLPTPSAQDDWTTILEMQAAHAAIVQVFLEHYVVRLLYVEGIQERGDIPGAALGFASPQPISEESRAYVEEALQHALGTKISVRNEGEHLGMHEYGIVFEQEKQPERPILTAFLAENAEMLGIEESYYKRLG